MLKIRDQKGWSLYLHPLFMLSSARNFNNLVVSLSRTYSFFLGSIFLMIPQFKVVLHRQQDLIGLDEKDKDPTSLFHSVLVQEFSINFIWDWDQVC